MSKTIIDIEKKYRYIGIENIAHAQEIFYNLFPNFEVRMTYNTRFKDKLQREQKHRHRLGDIDVKNIDVPSLGRTRVQTRSEIGHSDCIISAEAPSSKKCNQFWV